MIHSIMSETSQIIIILFAFFVLLVVYYAYKWKKKKEAQMGDDLDYYIEHDDWHSACRLMLKQLIIWGIVTLAAIAVTVSSYLAGQLKPHFIVLAIITARKTCYLAGSYFVFRRNEKYMEEATATEEDKVSDEELIQQAVELLRNEGMHSTRLDVSTMSEDEVMQTYLEALQRGKREGFCPVLIETDSAMVECMDYIYNAEGYKEWRQRVLSSPVGDGEKLLRENFEDIKKQLQEDEANGEDIHWVADVVGKDLHSEPIHHFEFPFSNNVLLAEVPVSHPWLIPAYIPFGGFNSCPTEEDHMAIAKYWYEKHGAVLAHISAFTLEYYVEHPVDKNDAMQLAEEQFGYCCDVFLSAETNLTTLAEMDTKSTVWYFWWD